MRSTWGGIRILILAAHRVVYYGICGRRRLDRTISYADSYLLRCLTILSKLESSRLECDKVQLPKKLAVIEKLTLTRQARKLKKVCRR
jgi:hypothetical protein